VVGARGKAAEPFTVVINTFKRHDLMQDSVKHYSSCSAVKHIYIVWCESDPPPENLQNRYSKSILPTITFSIYQDTSLNNRFAPISGPHTDGIFAVDDDIRVPCDELSLAHEVWRNSPRTLVGFMPRVHIRSSRTGEFIYRCWWKVWYLGYYSIILTKASFLHHDYLIKYTQEMPREIREYVDKNRNCEDIAMQFLVSNTTSLSPIYVKGHLTDLGALNGISTSKNVISAGHMSKRSSCLNDLSKLFNGFPLQNSHFIVDAASNAWSNAPSTWWEYISSDLWRFD
jgi:glucuronyl/N-acetylglucosaminyl transferase EXT2